ncbi:MAG: FAD-dependent oxidoreductase, partial [Amphritea sp.]|nr:FAD-dependent oxidoreductase [Amphritea sp.]
MQTIVIVGGGAGGLELATQLGHKLGKKNKARVILVDRNRTHIWKPLLHEVATGSLDINTDGVVYRAHAASHFYQFQLGTMVDLDLIGKRIRLQALLDEQGREVLPERDLAFDTLVMAVGSVSNDFGTPGVAEHSFFLDSHKQAERFHQALLNQFLKINQQSRDSVLKLAIVGGGATGVELAAELNHVADLLKVYGMPEMSADRLRIELIEAGPRILPALPDRIAFAARQELRRLGVNIREQQRVTGADEQGFLANEGERIEADLMVWA